MAIKFGQRSEESLARTKYIAGIERHPQGIPGQPEVNLLRNFLWLPNLVRKSLTRAYDAAIKTCMTLSYVSENNLK